MTGIRPGSIVVGTDGSPDADRAVTWAAEQAALERRPLTVVAVARQVPAIVAAGLGAAYAASPATDVLASARAVADAAVARAEAHRLGLAVSAVAVVGDPRHVLVELSAGAHLLVLGSRGRGRVASKLLGSVSAAVSRHALCAAVICRAGHGAPSRGVAVAADGTATSMPVVEFAFRQAAIRSLPLTVAYCVGEAPSTVDGTGDEEEQLLLAESVAGFRQQYPEVQVTRTTLRGPVEDCLAPLADAHDLLVLGRHPVDKVARRVSVAVSTSVLERAHTHVAVVPEA